MRWIADERAIAGLIILMLSSAAAAGNTSSRPVLTPVTAAGGPLHGELWRIPIADNTIEMRASVFRPAGRGPFPLVVINHGSTENADDRAGYATPVFPVTSAWFVRRGYAVVVPQRPGHGETGGPYLETAGSCDEARYQEAGDATAASIGAAVIHMLDQPFVRKTRVLLVGHSAGAWGSLALAGENPDLISGVINFAGGRGGHSFGIAGRNCAPDRLVAAAAAYGRMASRPTLWLYAQNDSFFDPGLSRRMADAFQSAGGRAEYQLLPPVEPDGHYLMEAPDAVRTWAPIVERFLGRLQ